MDSLTPSIPTGAPAPDFSLPALDGSAVRLSAAHGRIIILNFWSAECPWSERCDQALMDAQKEWGEAVQIWTIASNANEPRAQIETEAARRGLSHVLIDEQQRLADLYGAQTTPHLFVIDAGGVLRYQGALDDVTFRRRTPTVHYLRLVMDALLAGRPPDIDSAPPYGCTIVRS